MGASGCLPAANGWAEATATAGTVAGIATAAAKIATAAMAISAIPAAAARSAGALSDPPPPRPASASRTAAQITQAAPMTATATMTALGTPLQPSRTAGSSNGVLATHHRPSFHSLPSRQPATNLRALCAVCCCSSNYTTSKQCGNFSNRDCEWGSTAAGTPATCSGGWNHNSPANIWRDTVTNMMDG